MPGSTYFRVDAGGQIGIGHFMRCINLAEGLLKRDVHVTFLSRELPDALHQKAEKLGIKLKILCGEPHTTANTNSHSHWLPWSQETDVRLTNQAFGDNFIDWLIVDHYTLDHIWESQISDRVKKILVIDDLADRKHVCDLLIDQNFYPDMNFRYEGKVTPNTELLLGPEYALLHESFHRFRQRLYERDGEIKTLLVFFGGSDSGNCTELALNAIDRFELECLKVIVVIGALHSAIEEITIKCKENGYRLEVQSDQIASIMSEADISIGAGGVATWERCCLSLPSLVISIAANQEPIAEAVAGIGASQYLGRQSEVNVSQISNSLIKLMKEPQTVASMSTKAGELVDGKGVERVCEVMGY